ncbi:MAG TPA: PilZ domain-containing protein [Planctomycetota bacterium]|nr:PilZ domain-containing protein [Planctomycetota bacterium]
MSSSKTDAPRFERRRHIRVRVHNGQVRLRLTGLDEWTARVVDISEGGLGCVFRANDAYTEPLDYSLNIKDEMEILLDRGPREKELSVVAEVRTLSKRDDEPHAWAVGLRFVVTGNEAARNVQSALLRLAMIRLRNSLGVADSGVQPAASKSGSFPAQPRARQRLGEILINRGLVTEKILAQMLRESPPELAADRLGQRLVKSGLVDGDAVAQALAVQAGVDYYDLKIFDASQASAHLLPATYRDRWGLLPIENNRRLVHLVAANLPDPATQRLIEERCGRRVKYSIGNENRIAELLKQLAQLEKPRLPKSSGLSLIQPRSGAGGDSNRAIPTVSGEAETAQALLSTRGTHLRDNRPAVVYQFRTGTGANLHPELLAGRLKTCDTHSIRVVGPVWDERLLPADILTASPLVHVEICAEKPPASNVVLIGRPTQITHVVGAFFLIEFLIVRISEADLTRYQAFMKPNR